MSFLTPQDKKRLSYAHDRRNAYGENAKASRKAIPLRKREDRQNDRRVAKQALPVSLVASDLLADDSAENCIAVHQAEKKRTRWRKTPDVPLRDIVRGKKEVHSPLMKKKPNKAPEPTTMSVTPRAILRAIEMNPRNPNRDAARVAPAMVVAHL